MSRKHCNRTCRCHNPFNNANDLPAFSNSTFNSLAILFLFFGGGFGPGSFWGPYNQIYGCSGFNCDWCSNNGFTSSGSNIPTALNSAASTNNYF